MISRDTSFNKTSVTNHMNDNDFPFRCAGSLVWLMRHISGSIHDLASIIEHYSLLVTPVFFYFYEINVFCQKIHFQVQKV